jgi:hypothetical protein
VGCKTGATDAQTFRGELAVAPPLVFRQVVRQGRDGVDGLNSAESIALSPDGAYLYVASGFPGTMAIFTRDADGGALTFALNRC